MIYLIILPLNEDNFFFQLKENFRESHYVCTMRLHRHLFLELKNNN